jgi:small GTP-binding protein
MDTLNINKSVDTLEHINIKTVLLGSSNVGKSSLINRYIHNVFSEWDSAPTIGVSFFHKTIHKYNAKFNLAIWDTGGQERYRSLMPMYYRKSHLVFICVDLNSTTINKDINYWIEEVTNHTLEKPLIYLVGTKVDTISDNRLLDAISETISNNYGGYQFYMTSSKANTNINNLFNNAMENAVDNRYYSILNSPGLDPKKSTEIDSFVLEKANNDSNSYYSNCYNSTANCSLM